jgi:hypothetical protein
MTRPIIYLAFANDSDAHLALLKEESRQLNSLLGALHDKQAIEVHRDESVSVADLLASFNRFNGRVALFHYGGHAGGQGLRLEAGDAQAAGLAELLSQQEQLQLVFLNGCSTLPQVARLLELGVKAVIATSVPIEDTKAKDFATAFYQALAVKRSLRSAFDFAVASLKTKYAAAPAAGVIKHRAAEWITADGAPLDTRTELPWGLYVQEAHQDVLDWRLPAPPIQRFLANPLTNYSPNDYLPKILGAMARYDSGLRQVIEEIKAGRKDKREVLPIIVQNLPWTIGAQLQKLISRSDSMRTPGLPRLQQTVNTYVITAQVLLYILVSQLWEYKRSAGKAVPEAPLSGLLELDAKGVQFFDHVAAMVKVARTIEAAGAPFFVEEFGSLLAAFDQKEAFYKAYLLLESIREQLGSGSLDAGAAAPLCEEAENALTIFIGSVSFLIKYKMVAVRDITVDCYRFQEVAFQHKLGSLNAADSAYLTLDSDRRPFPRHAESGSILLVDDQRLDNIDRFLSLSPFIIDNNSFLDMSQEALDIYLFSHAEGDAYVYKNVNSQYQKMEEHATYTISTAYEETVEVKDEVDFGWEVDAATVKKVRPYRVLQEQFDNLKADLTTA